MGVAVPRTPLRVAWGDDRVRRSVSRTSRCRPHCHSLAALGWALESSLVEVALEAVVLCRGVSTFLPCLAGAVPEAVAGRWRAAALEAVAGRQQSAPVVACTVRIDLIRGDL